MHILFIIIQYLCVNDNIPIIIINNQQMAFLMSYFEANTETQTTNTHYQCSLIHKEVTRHLSLSDRLLLLLMPTK